MHEVLRQRLLRRIESLPESQIYQVLDFIEFLESKYARESAPVEPTMLQKFAEGLEDRMRKKAMNPATLREAFQLIAAADRVLADVSSAGKQIMDEIGNLAEPAPPASPGMSGRVGSGPRSGSRGRRVGGSRDAGGRAGASDGSPGGGRGRSGDRDAGLGDEWSPPAGGSAGEGRREP